MSYWTFSNVFEEGGVPSGIFNSNFGLTDQWGIARPSLHAFTFLHKLGETRLQCGDGPVLATRRADGSVAILLWNLIPSKDAGSVANGNPVAVSGGALKSTGQEKTFQLRLNGLDGRTNVNVSQVGADLGTAIPKWVAMGSPAYPSQEQIGQLRTAAEAPPPKRQILPSKNRQSSR